MMKILTKYIEQIKGDKIIIYWRKTEGLYKLFVVLWLSRVNYLEYNKSIITKSLETIRNNF